MKLTYNEIYTYAEYGRVEHGRYTYPVQSCCKQLVEEGIKGPLEIYPNNDTDKTGSFDAVYPSIANAANNNSATYITNSGCLKGLK